EPLRLRQMVPLRRLRYALREVGQAIMYRQRIPPKRFVFVATVWLFALFGAPASAAAPASATPSYALTRFGEIRPAGWMVRQMKLDLDEGLAGHYPDISDTVNAQQFEKQQANQVDAAGEPGWWLGEHEGYYADGLFRLAWLAGTPSQQQTAIARLES